MTRSASSPSASESAPSSRRGPDATTSTLLPLEDVGPLMPPTFGWADAGFWDGLAERYAKRPVEAPDAFERKIAITKANMHPHHVVLDIGCGTGSLALRLAHAGAHIHGLDLSPAMVRIARAKADAEGVGNVTFHVGAFDAELDAFEPESLDGVLAFSLLHLVEDRAAALAQMYALLRPGGFFVASTVCLAGGWVPYRAILAVMRWLRKAPRVAIVGKATVRDEIRAAGFVDLTEPDVGAGPRTSFVVASKPR